MKKEVIRFLLFVFIITLFLGVCFTSADFFTIPVAGTRDFLVVAAQWVVVLIPLFLLCVALSAYRVVFAVGFPLLTLACSVLAWFRLTLNATLTPMILDAALQNDWRTSADLLSPGLVAVTLASLLTALGLVAYRWRCVVVRCGLVPLLVGLGLLFGLMQLFVVRRPVSERIPFTL